MNSGAQRRWTNLSMVVVLLIALSQLLPATAGAAIRHEQTISGGSSASTTIATSGAVAAGSGNLYLAAVAARPGGVRVTSITGLGLDWTLVKAQCAGRDQTALEVWRGTGTAAAGGVVTATLNGATSNAVIEVSRYSGVDAAAPIGSVASANTTGVSGTCSGGADNSSYSLSLPTSMPNSVAYGAVAMRNRKHTPGSGYTERAERIQGGGGNAAGAAVMDREVPSASAVRVDGSFSGSVDWALVALEIRPGSGSANHAPIAQDQTVSTSLDTPKAIVLTASDPDGDPLSYAVTAQPEHGVLMGDPPNLTYTPNPGYFGPDGFMFIASDGNADSNLATVSISVNSTGTSLDERVAHALDFAASRLDATARSIGKTQYPFSARGASWLLESASSWGSGFFPGALWWMYERTGDLLWRTSAEEWTAGLESQKTRTNTHDVGFIIYDSFGRGYGLTAYDSYRPVVLTAAGSLATRYSPIVGCTRSWDGSNFIVIIDNMMNIEMLFWAARNGGDPAYYDMARTHAETTMLNHVREDGSTYHVVEYSESTGAIVRKRTSQGYAAESTWSRGQAWAVYGFTMAYRETRDQRFLQTAQKAADYFLSHLPADKVPLWDFEVPANDSRQYKDSSAAAIAAAGLLELSQYQASAADRDRYWLGAADILDSLTSPAYLAEGTSSPAILLHGARNVPSNGDVDSGLIWGDHYFIEAMRRYDALTRPLPTMSFSVANSTLGEAAGLTRFTVNLSAKSAFPVTVDYSIAGVTATAGVDYTPANGVLVFDPGQTSKSVEIHIVDDILVEANETVELVLGNPVGAVAGAMSSHSITILDNDTGTLPQSPANLQAVPGSGEVTLTWEPAVGATSYSVRRSTASGSGYSTIALGVAATVYTDTGVAGGTTYYYVVAGVNAAGESAPSNEAVATPTLSPPLPPANLRATSGNTQVVLTWDASAGATGYNVSRGSSAGIESPLATGITATSYTDAAVVNGSTYYYVVSAVNAAGESGPSNEAVAAPAPPGIIEFREVQTGGSGSSAAVSTSTRLTGAAGNLYVAAVATRNGSVSVTSITGLGLTWTLVRAQCAGRNQTRLELWRAIGIPTGDGVVTAALSASASNAVIEVSRYSGVNAITPIGNVVSANTTGANGACGGGVDTASYSVNLTTTVPGAVIYGAAAMRNRTHTPGAGYTERAEKAQGSSGEITSAATMDRPVPSASTVQVNGTFSSTVDWSVIAVELRP